MLESNAQMEIKTPEKVREHNRLLQLESEALRKNSDGWVSLDFCESCNSRDIEQSGEKWGYKLHRCQVCGYTFISPRPNESVLRGFYKDSKASEYFQREIIEPALEARIERIFRPRQRLISETIGQTSGGRVLDIGCSVGLLLDELKGVGWDTYGNEYSDYAVQAATKKGHNVSDKDLVSYDKDMFGLVTCFEVIEHTFSPSKMLKDIWKILSHDGYLVLSFPSIDGFEFQIAGNIHPNIAPPGHLNYFGSRSVEQILESCGFKVVNILTPGFLDIRNIENMIRAGELKTTGCIWLDGILLDSDPNIRYFREGLQRLIADHKMSGHMVVFAKKV